MVMLSEENVGYDPQYSITSPPAHQQGLSNIENRVSKYSGTIILLGVQNVNYLCKICTP